MTDRLPQEAVTYVGMALTKTTSAVIAGVQLSKRIRTDSGGVWHEPYRTISLNIDDPQAQSIRSALPIVCIKALGCVDADTRLVIYRSPHPYFRRVDRYEAEPLNSVVLAGQVRGIDVKFSYKPGLHRVIIDLQRLANDAIRQGNLKTEKGEMKK